jgi:hypothetical protein
MTVMPGDVTALSLTHHRHQVCCRVEGETGPNGRRADQKLHRRNRAGWTIQPDLQYVWRPRGGTLAAAGRAIRKALMLGARTTIRY